MYHVNGTPVKEYALSVKANSLSVDRLAALSNPSTLAAIADEAKAPQLKALATKVNLTKLFATLDRDTVFETTDPKLLRHNDVYLKAWTYFPEYIDALREVLTDVCREAYCYSMHTVYIDGDVIGETEGYDDSELTRSYLCEQIQELVRLSIKYSGLV